MPKKSFKEDVQGADKLFSANDAPRESTEKNPEHRDQQAITSNNISANVLTNILDSIKTDEPTGANYTFYLSAETAAALAATAKKKKISRSKLVDTILKQVLLGEI